LGSPGHENRPVVIGKQIRQADRAPANLDLFFGAVRIREGLVLVRPDASTAEDEREHEQLPDQELSPAKFDVGHGRPAPVQPELPRLAGNPFLMHAILGPQLSEAFPDHSAQRDSIDHDEHNVAPTGLLVKGDA
jgi:hypothetical protein